MRTVEIAPTAAALLKSLRGLGYTPETALADLIDNSIAAGADLIELSVDWNHGDTRIAVRDDGQGMNADRLEDAMRFGSDDEVERTPGDLGRFGLGLKTAALSQCRRVTVISVQGGPPERRSWDVDLVNRTRKWTVLVDADMAPFDHVKIPAAGDTGTLVALETMDEMGGLHGLDSERFYARLAEIRAHFAMVFHRFLAGDQRRIRITVNGRDVSAWDPMLATHPSTRKLGSGPVGSGKQAVRVTSWVLPHRDRFATEPEFLAAGGPGGWAERQGFYVYRGGRLVVAGSWLGLGERREWTKDESSRLARIAIDLPVTCDSSWRIDVRKARARPPAALRSRLLRIGQDCRERAREVFAFRGGQVRGPATKRDVSPMWQEEHVSGRRRYRVNRQHPLIEDLFSRGGDIAKSARAVISLIERTVPVERIWLDVSEDVETTPGVESSATLIEDLVTALRHADGNESVEAMLDGLLRSMRIDDASLRSAVLAQLGSTR